MRVARVCADDQPRAFVANPQTGSSRAQVNHLAWPALRKYVNRSYRRTGTLWDSRYKSSSVQAETYLLACQRYIELNPVRAAMVEDPAHYRWTSYRANGLGQPDARLTPHELYRALGRNDKERQTNYRGLFGAQLDRAAIDDIRLALNQSQPLGNARFYAKIEQMTGQRREARPRGRPRMESNQSEVVLPGQRSL